jgi:hypothetical protein
MRRSTRTSLMALLVAVVAFAAAGCGGSEVASDEVPGAPPALTVPSDNELGSSGSNAADNASSQDGTGSSTDSSADSGTADSGAADSATPTPTPDTSGGAAAPEATAAPDTATSDQPPAAGSPPEQFENFCEQNAGAC